MSGKSSSVPNQRLMNEKVAFHSLPLQRDDDDVEETARHVFVSNFDNFDDIEIEGPEEIPQDGAWPEVMPELGLVPLGVPSSQPRTFLLSNKMGMTVQVEDEAGNVFLTGSGKFRPIGYNFSFKAPDGTPVFGLVSRRFHRRETYEWQQPDGCVLATILKGLVQKRTSLHLHAGKDRDKPYLVKCKSTKTIGGQFCITTPAGEPLGYVKRVVKKGMVTKQYYSIQVGPGVDPNLIVMFAIVCNCVWNERPWLFWGTLAGAVMVL